MNREFLAEQKLAAKPWSVSKNGKWRTLPAPSQESGQDIWDFGNGWFDRASGCLYLTASDDLPDVCDQVRELILDGYVFDGGIHKRDEAFWHYHDWMDDHYSIADGAFLSRFPQLTSVTIFCAEPSESYFSYADFTDYEYDAPEVMLIPPECFAGLDKLEQVEIHCNYPLYRNYCWHLIIGSHAFRDCRNLKRVKAYGHNGCYCAMNAFHGCRSIRALDGISFAESFPYHFDSATLPEKQSVFGNTVTCYDWDLDWNVTENSEVLFDIHDSRRNDPHVKFLQFLEHVKKIPIMVCYGCVNLEEVGMWEGVEVIGESAFEGAASLKKICLPNTLKVLERRAFSCCESLPQIEIPPLIICFEEETFFCCSSLSRIIIPESVAYIHPTAFEGCENLKEVLRPGGTPVPPDAYGGIFAKLQ